MHVPGDIVQSSEQEILVILSSTNPDLCPVYSKIKDSDWHDLSEATLRWRSV